MTASVGTKGPSSGVLYLVHFTQPYRHARHYAGWTADLDSRPSERQAGRGARPLQVITQAGIDWTLARTWQSTRQREQQPKRQGGASRRCPICRAERRGPTMSKYRVIVSDQLQSVLAGHDGVSYQSPPQPYQHALQLVRALLGLQHLSDECGPWRQARPGGTRTVRIEQAP